MLTIPFAIGDTEYSIFVALQDDNIARIKEYDPAEINMAKLAGGTIHWSWEGRTLKDIIIGYITPEEIVKVQAMAQEGKMREALKMLSRGFRYRPEMGDSNEPYKTLL